MVEASPAPLPPMPMLWSPCSQLWARYTSTIASPRSTFPNFYTSSGSNFYERSESFAGYAQSRVKSVAQSSPILSFTHAFAFALLLSSPKSSPLGRSTVSVSRQRDPDAFDDAPFVCYFSILRAATTTATLLVLVFIHLNVVPRIVIVRGR